ncbi:MAG: sigma-70 family RNA polymerase sigma factor [Chloroflexales bacterium]|nr:sigma-70 family RNA polymerase sigma factor [Chloroflexales bacterium]
MMMRDRVEPFSEAINQALALERPRLVRLCASLTGDAAVAEDLAQETLLEAWRIWSRLNDPAALSPWLAAIARNVCLRWRRSAACAPLIHPANPADLDQADRPNLPAGVDDTLCDLERHELATLLDRALALLPSDTRVALVQHYIEEMPQAAIATRLGMSEGAVAARIYRGKRAFRRLLVGELRADADVFGLLPPDEMPAGWREARIWCPECGQHRLLGRLDQAAGDFMLRCPRCSPEPGLEISYAIEHLALFNGIYGLKAAHTRMLNWSYRYYRGVLAQRHTGAAACAVCERPVPVQLHIPHDDPLVHPALRGQRGVYVLCDCQSGAHHFFTCTRGLTLHLPQVRQFWRAHPRMCALPEREIDLGGCAGIVTGFESLGGPARIEVVALRDSYEVLSIHGASDDVRHRK